MSKNVCIGMKQRLNYHLTEFGISESTTPSATMTTPNPDMLACTVLARASLRDTQPDNGAICTSMRTPRGRSSRYAITKERVYEI
jgi:hypothetical protein